MTPCRSTSGAPTRRSPTSTARRRRPSGGTGKP
nr:MAG TPA: hypothetical protein [Caudoviricetes sp.]